MEFFQRNKTKKIIAIFTIVIILSFSFIDLFQWKNVLVYKSNDTDDTIDKTEITNLINDIFLNRNKALLKGDLKFIKSIYDTNTKYGVWAYEHEEKKIKYLHNWEEKQGVKFIDIKPNVVIKNIKKQKDNYSINLICSAEYKYVYEDDLKKVNTSIIGTSHLVKIANKNNKWVITKEWYKDPFADSLNINNLKAEDIREHIVTSSLRDFSSLNDRRLKAIEYADKYCGAASTEEHGYKYNKNYRDYNPKGGDCANFASQILFEGGKFKKNSAWNYDSKGATRAWVNADGFKDYMIYSGRASVIAHGDYEKVYKASYNLLPGDFVAYEKKGDITHISVVTGADSKGYSLVSCHNTDRNKVPWDLGWSNKGIKFWLVRVHF
ncbi:amidase domain-containing protein [Clostridium botulinum]|nr:amidase domain-containing protein [Clostridium botulinum]